MSDHDPKPLIERNEAFRRANRAINEFGPVSFFEDEKVGALLESLRFYCDQINSRSAVPLWEQALAVAERLHAERLVAEAAFAEKCREDMERRKSGVADDEDPYCPECGEDDPKMLLYRGRSASGLSWQCATCRHEFQTGLKEIEE